MLMVQLENNFYERTITVKNRKKNTRLDHFLTNFFSAQTGDSEEITTEELLFSRNRIQKFIDEGKILVNEIPVKQSYKVKNDDVIYIKIPLKFDNEFNIVPKDIFFEVIYFDKDIIVINKPDNLVVHPAYGHYTDTLVNGLIKIFPDLEDDRLVRHGIVHRLDKDTSGLLIIARNSHSQNNLVLQFKQRIVKKKYIAITYGKLEKLEGVINTRIGRNPLERKKRSVLLTSGKESITYYRVMEYLRNATFVELSPHTGRTHQLRVHMAYLRHPILGDKIYSRGKSGFHRLGLMLCAKEISFNHPVTEQKMEFKIEIPERFKIILEKGEI